MNTRIATMFVVGLLAPLQALAQQSVVLSGGYFSVRKGEMRVADDVLQENLDLFAFDLADFNSGTLGGEWLLGFGDYLDVGVGAGFYRRTVPSTYTDFVEADGGEIEQDFRLRVVPITGTIRLSPLGRRAVVQPYVGGGLGILRWNYTEAGDFVDFSDLDVLPVQRSASGTDVGAVLLAGVRIRFGDRFSTGAELQYRRATGRVEMDQGFLDERIDLGGLTTQLTFQVEF